MPPRKKKKNDDDGDELVIYRGSQRHGQTIVQHTTAARIVEFEETDGRMSGRQQYVANIVEVSTPTAPLIESVPPPAAIDIPSLANIDDDDDDYMYSPPTVDDTYTPSNHCYQLFQ